MMTTPTTTTGLKSSASGNILREQNPKKFVSNMEEETFEMAREMAGRVKPGDLLLLSGELGSGKTAFVKGLAAGMDIKQRVKSPTFSIINVYTAETIPLYHIDLYRLETVIEMEDTGVFDCIYNNKAVCVVEWGNRIERFMNKSYLSISFYNLGEDKRIIEIDDHVGIEGNLSPGCIKGIP